MRTLRERPRMVAAQVLVALLLLGAGVLLGLAVSGDDTGGGPDARVTRAERSAARNARVARFFRTQLARSRADAKDAARRADRSAAANRRLRTQLRRNRRGRRRARKKGG